MLSNEGIYIYGVGHNHVGEISLQNKSNPPHIGVLWYSYEKGVGINFYGIAFLNPSMLSIRTTSPDPFISHPDISAAVCTSTLNTTLPGQQDSPVPPDKLDPHTLHLIGMDVFLSQI